MTTESATALISSSVGTSVTSGLTGLVRSDSIANTELCRIEETVERLNRSNLPDNVIVKYYGTIPQYVHIIVHGEKVSISDIFDSATRHLETHMKTISDSNTTGFYPCTTPLFGLVNECHSLWICTFSAIRSNNNCFYYRFRYRLSGDASYYKLYKMDNFAGKYLFMQCRDDFINNRIEAMYEEKMSEKMLGMVAMDLLIPKTSHDYKIHLKNQNSTQSHDPLRNFNLLSLYKELPRRCRKMFRLPWRYLMLYFNLRSKLRDMGSRSRDPDSIQMAYIQAIFREIPEYCLETYNIYPVNMSIANINEALDIGVTPDGLYFNKQYVRDLDNINSVQIKRFEEEEMVRIFILFSDRTPHVVKCSYEKAMSFASVLNGYYKLTVNYDFDLFEELKDVTYDGLNSFGPMIREDAIKLLREKLNTFETINMAVRSVFLIRQRLHCYKMFELVSCSKVNQENQTCNFEYISGEYKLTEDGRIFPTATELLKYFKITFKRQIKPAKGELADQIWIHSLFPNKIEYYGPEEKIGSNTKCNEPQYIDECQFQIISANLRKDSFIQVFKIQLNTHRDQDMAMIQLSESTLSQHKPTTDDLQVLASKIYRIQHKSFVHFYGTTICPPLRIFVDHSPYGDLQYFIETFFKDKSLPEINPTTSKDTDNTDGISFLQIITTNITVANGLQYLNDNKLIHGNLRCKNILVYGLTNAQIAVKIADPGLVSYYNKQSLTDLFNRERIPWIAVELFEDLSKCTTDSEIYSFATLLWEFVSYGRNPLTALCNIGVNAADISEVKNYFLSGKQLTQPPSLKEDRFYLPITNEIRADLWQLMTSCWEISPDDRPSITDIQRKLKLMLDKFGEFEEKEIDILSLKENRQTIATCNLIYRNQLELCKDKLGEGHYGYVLKGFYYKNPSQKSQDTERKKGEVVAIKQLKDDPAKFDPRTREMNKKMFSEEVKIMEALNHMHVVQVIGVCYEASTMLVMEYVQNGSLREWLKKSSQDLVIQHLFRLSTEIAQGMIYLSDKKIIHRDLAARNILLTSNLSVKISDFGLAKELKDKDYYKLQTAKSLPMHWTAPECFPSVQQKGVFSTKSDVWSYGVVLWEIYKKGSDPYLLPSNVSNLSKYVEELNNGRRLEKIDNWPEVIKNVIDKCWILDRVNRPSFENIYSELNNSKEISS